MNKRAALTKFAIAGALLLVIYIPMFKWMIDRWMAAESYYNHGVLIPIVSGFLAWQRRNLFKDVEFKGNVAGLLIVVMALILHMAAAVLRVYFISGFSFVMALCGLIIFVLGVESMKKLVFPVFFLCAMIPLPLVLVANLTVKLKLFVAEIATIILNKIGFPTIREGSLLKMPNSFLLVEAPCSGLRSLISLITLGLLFAYAIKISYFKKSVLFLSSMPIAVATNLIRVLLLAVVNDIYGEKVAMGFFHDFSGFLMFGLAFLGLYSISVALEGKDKE
jgi:exosortase